MTLFWTLAFDHRNSFRTEFLGSGDDPQLIRSCKSVIAAGLLGAVEDGLSEGRPVALLDDEYGVDAARLVRRAGVDVALAVEASGRAELAFAHDPFQQGLELLEPAFAKVLVRYNPGGDAALNERQRARLGELERWLGTGPTRLMLELLVPATPAQMQEAGGDRGVYDARLRPALTARAVSELGAAGIAPRLWKLEGMPTSEAYRAVADEIQPGAGCLVLGRGEDRAAVERWLSTAAGVPGYTGFAVGRTLWWEPLRSYVQGELEPDAAAAAIAANYRALIDVYLAARSDATAS